MAIHCLNKKTATINYFDLQGQPSKVTVNQCPVDVQVITSDESQFIFTLTDYGYGSNCSSNGVMYIDTVAADSYEVSSTNNPSNNPNCPWYQVEFFRGVNKIYSAKKGAFYSISSSPNPNLKKFLKIKNSQGTEIFTAEVKNSNYKVSCDDECPEGFCRCPIPEYPGYCCLDCNSTAASIRAITNELRGKNA